MLFEKIRRDQEKRFLIDADLNLAVVGVLLVSDFAEWHPHKARATLALLLAFVRQR